MAVADRFGFPLAVHTTSASPHEVKLVGTTICERFTDERPGRIIGDKAYDSDPLDAELKKLDIELIAPHKANRKKAQTQDGRCLRRYRRPLPAASRRGALARCLPPEALRLAALAEGQRRLALVAGDRLPGESAAPF